MSQCGPYSNHQPVWHWVKPLAAPIAVLKRKSRLWRVTGKLTFSMSSCLRRKAYPPLFPPVNHYEDEYLCTFMVSTHMHAKSKKWAVEKKTSEEKQNTLQTLETPHHTYPPNICPLLDPGITKVSESESPSDGLSLTSAPSGLHLTEIP